MMSHNYRSAGKQINLPRNMKTLQTNEECNDGPYEPQPANTASEPPKIIAHSGELVASMRGAGAILSYLERANANA